MKQPGISVSVLWRRLSAASQTAIPQPAGESLASELGRLALWGRASFLITCLLMWKAGAVSEILVLDLCLFQPIRRTGDPRDRFRAFKFIDSPRCRTRDLDLGDRRRWADGIPVVFARQISRRVCRSVSSVLHPGSLPRPLFPRALLHSYAAGGVASGWAGCELRNRQTVRVEAIAHSQRRPLFLFLAAFVCSIYGQREIFFEMTPLEVCRTIYGANPFPEALDLAQVVKNQTPQGLRWQS